MLNAKAFANAFGVVGLIVFVVCRVISLVAPDLLFAVGRSWFHTFSLDSLRATIPMDLGTFLLGAVSTFVLVWLTTFSGVILYNRWSKRG